MLPPMCNASHLRLLAEVKYQFQWVKWALACPQNKDRKREIIQYDYIWVWTEQ